MLMMVPKTIQGAPTTQFPILMHMMPQTSNAIALTNIQQMTSGNDDGGTIPVKIGQRLATAAANAIRPMKPGSPHNWTCGSFSSLMIPPFWFFVIFPPQNMSL
jgi:hypothetical protein